MTKREFDAFINQNLKDLSLEDQEVLLGKIYDWSKERVRELDNILEQNYVKCNNCGKYILKKKIKNEANEPVEYYDIFYEAYIRVQYVSCPYCDADVELEKTFIGPGE